MSRPVQAPLHRALGTRTKAKKEQGPAILANYLRARTQGLRDEQRTCHVKGDDTRHPRNGGCGQDAAYTEQMYITAPAKNFVMAFSRFHSFRFRDETGNVQFRDARTRTRIDLANSTHLQVADKDFELYATLCRTGSRSTSGHWMAIVRHGSQWVACSDARVRTITDWSDKELLQSTATMFCYRQR